MRHLGVLCARQVGDGAGHLEGAVRGAGRPPQPGGSRLQKLQRCGLQQGMDIDRLPLQGLVGIPLARRGPLAGLHHAHADGRAAFTRGCIQQILCRQGWHLDMQVDAVEQWAAEPRLVARHLVRRATAGALRGAPVAAGARVHGGNHLKTRGELSPLRSPRDSDMARLQRLAQGFEGGAGKLWQLVQKEYAMMRQRDLAGARR